MVIAIIGFNNEISKIPSLGMESGKISCDTFLFLSGNFRCKDDGDSQGIRIKSFVVFLSKSVYNGKQKAWIVRFHILITEG